jgi:nicotinate-nucleotide adenylyltransferase
MKKIGIMGGTFNPIHYGHLFLAENAYEQIGFDKVLFMPSKNPPHKAKPDEVTEQQRVEMVELAIADNPHFELSTLELNREGYTYTADTLTMMTQSNPNTKYYFIVGADSLFMMQKWKEPQIIFNHCIVVVAGRDNVEKEKINQHAQYLKNVYNANILQIEMPTIQIASAIIRERIVQNKTIRYYVPDKVEDYIKKNKLYMTCPEDIR